MPCAGKTRGWCSGAASSPPAAPHAQPAAPSLRHPTKTVLPAAAAPEPANHSPRHVLQQIPRAQEFNTLRLACTPFQSTLHPAFAFATPSPASRGQSSLNHRNRPHSGLSPLAPQQPLAESSHSARTHTSKRDLNTGRQTPHCSSPTSIASPTFPFDSTWRTLALAQKPMVACTSGPRPNRCTCIAQTRPNKRYSH
jgi:hypothetical protein